MHLHSGVNRQIISLNGMGPGTYTGYFGHSSDTVLLSLWVEDVTGGSVTVKAYTYQDDAARRLEIISFPEVTSGTSELLIRKAAVTLQQVAVEVEVTGTTSLSLWARPLTAGESSVRILGATSWRVDVATTGPTPSELLPISLTDRQGVLLKNITPSVTVWIAESSAKANETSGYPIIPGEVLSMDIGAGQQLFASSASSANLRILQGGST